MALVWAALVGLLTLRPNPEALAQVDRTPWHCLVCGDAGVIDVLQNLLLFLPIGIAGRRLGWRWPRTVGIAFVATVAIELTQATVLTGRDAALGDVVANTLGGLMGWMAGGRVLEAIARPGGPVATRLALALLTGMLGLFGATGWLLSPVASEGIALTTRAGVAISADGWPVPVGTAVLAQRADTTTLRVATTWVAPRPIAREPIARLEAGDGTLWAAIDRRGTTLGTELRLRSSTLRLRTPIIAAPAPPLVAGDPVAVRTTWVGNRVETRVIGPSDTVRVAGRFGPQHGWVLFTPFTARYDFAGSWSAWTLAWLAGWGVLLGWFAGGMRGRWLAGLAALAILGVTSGRAGVPVRPREAIAFAAAWLTASAAGAGSAARPRRSPGGA